jgi:hypothetical protein
VEPELEEALPEHLARCWLYQDHPESGFRAPLKAAEGATR